MRRTLPLLLAALLSGCSVAAPGVPGQPSVPSPEPTAAAAPSPAPTAITLSAEARLDEGGFSLRHPAGWATRATSSTLTLAPSEAALASSSPGEGLVVTVDSTPLDALVAQYGDEAARSPEAFFEVSSGAAQEAGYTISATTPITVAGRPGLAADLAAPGGAGRLAVLLAEDRAVRVLGQAAPTAWESQRELFTALLESLDFFAPPVQPTPSPTPRAAEQPVIVDRGPAGFVLRLGGSAGPDAGRFISARGLAAAPDGTLYLAESGKGLWVFAPDGQLIGVYGTDDLLDAYDVVRAQNGDLFVADYGRNAVARFSADGSFIERWGSAGDADEQFGLSSPQRIALGPDGDVYALDTRPGLGAASNSVIRFRPDGTFVARISLPDDLSPADLAVDTAGNIYLAETFGGTVVKISPAGEELIRIGDPADPERFSAGALDIDRQGNIYLATYSAGVMKLGPDGTLIAQGGAAAAPGVTPRPGEFALPNGIVAAPGNVVWVSDNSGEYSAVSALRLVSDPVGEATAAAAATAMAPTATAIPAADLLRQWASEATASSFYAPDYGPDGATGPPDVEGCQDSPDAWASADPNGLETIELRFRTRVFAIGLNIYQNHQPGFISKVELLDERGRTTQVYSGEPALSANCPGTLELSFEQTLTRIVAVRITVDQRSGANWSEIDAVELVGLP